MTARSITLALIFIATAIGITGCGSDDETSSGSDAGASVTTSSLSKDEFIKQAEAVCQRERKDLAEQVLLYLQRNESGDQSRAAEAALFARMTKAVVVPTIERELAAIRKLGAPEGDEEEIEAFIAEEQEAIEALSKVRTIQSRFQIERYFTPAARLAIDYGLDKCANGEVS